MPRNLEQEIDELRQQIEEIKKLLKPSEPTSATEANGLLQLIESRMAEKVLSCIGNNDRLNILLSLLKEPMTVAALVEKRGYSSTGQVYHHLKPLLAADLIAEDRSTSKGTYVVQPHRVEGLTMMLEGIRRMTETPQGEWNAEIHNGATMVDQRYMTDSVETKKIIATYFSSLEPLVLKELPAKEKRKLVILQVIAGKFEAGRRYTEGEVNKILKGIYNDNAHLRRYLIEYGFMDRADDCSEYWLKQGV